MYIFITLGLMLATIISLVVLRIMRPGAPYAWLVAALGSLLAWVSVFFWPLKPDDRVLTGIWQPETLFHVSPALTADSVAWLFSLSLTAMAAGVILTALVRPGSVSSVAWAGTLMITLLGVLAALASNPLTLVMVWVAIDLVEFTNTLWTVNSPSLSERTVIAFGIRALGTAFALLAGIFSIAQGAPLSFDVVSGQPGIFLLLAAGLRLGVLPLHLPYRNEPSLRRGFGTAIRLTAAASSTVLLARISLQSDNFWALFTLIGLATLAGLYGGWKWLSISDEISARPYWMIGMGALAVIATLRGNPTGSTAWGVTLILLGSLSFLHSARSLPFNRLMAVLAAFMVGLPFTLTASVWQGDGPLSVVFWPFWVITHGLLAAGYIRHSLRVDADEYTSLPRWAQTSYPAGLGIPVVTIVVASLWGWKGALTIGAWGAAIAVNILVGLIAFVLIRFAVPASPARITEQVSSRLTVLQEGLGNILWGLYVLLGRLIGFISNLLEGDGGLLWTLLLLVLIFSILQVR